MITRFERIANLGTFSAHEASGEPPFGQVTIVYGNNGSGKTTLAAALDSARSGDGSMLAGRQTLGSGAHPDVVLSTTDGELILREGSWNAALYRLEVFYQGFVDRNVFTGSIVTNSHKQNLCEFVLGASSVAMATRIADLSALSAAASKRIGEQRKIIETHLTGSVSVDQFIRLQPVPEIEKAIESAQRDVKSVDKLAELKARKRPRTPDHVRFDDREFRTFLAADLQGVSLEAMKLVRDHVSTVLDRTEGQKWLAYGLAHVTDNLCPYCAQDLTDSPIATAYADFFSAAFKAHMVELRSQEARFMQVLGAEGRQSALKDLLDAREKALAWMNDCLLDVKALRSPIEPVEESWGRHAEVLLTAVARKLESPTDPIELDESIEVALSGLQSALSRIGALRTAVHDAEQLITQRMVLLESMKPQEILQRLALLQNTEKRYRPEVARVCDRLVRLEKAKGRVDAAKERERGALNRRMDALLSKYKEDINQYLRVFGTRIQIVSERVDHRTRQPKVEYKLQVAGHEVDLGDGGTLASTPCLGNTLSDGDKNSLALAFFLAHLKRCDLASTIVVIDDPVNSLDRHRRGQTCNEIVRLARECRQVVVLTHEPRLARALWKATPAGRLCTLATARHNGTNTLVAWDIERGTADRYFRGYLDLCKYVEEGGDPGAATRQVRQLLEGYLRRRFPGRWGEKVWLGTMLGNIRNAVAGDPLLELQGHFYDELEDINDLTKRFHHDEGADTEDDIELDDASALSIATRALLLVGTSLAERQPL